MDVTTTVRAASKTCVLLLLLTLAAGCAQRAPTASIGIDVVDPPQGTEPFHESGILPIRSGMTALDQLRDFTAQRHLELNTTFYPSLGSTAVNSIGHIASQSADAGRFYFWRLDLNGKASEVGADQVPLHDRDAVRWAFVLG